MPTIRNRNIEVAAKTKGAELSGIRTADGVEYLWQADPAFWPRQSPLLFPIVGNLPGKTYSYGGKTYALDNHGFIKAKEFRIVEEQPESMLFESRSDAETLEIYPFSYRISVGYAVKGSTLSVGWAVKNEDDKAMPFSIGAHPAFRAPLVSGETREDYDLLFEKKETALRHFLTPANVLSGETGPFLEGKDRIRVTPDLFERGAVVLKDHESRSVTLKSGKTGRYVKVDFEGFPYLGIWSPKGDSTPFVCIEPWYGVMPLENSTQDITRKEGVLTLSPGETFRAEYGITVG